MVTENYLNSSYNFFIQILIHSIMYHWLIKPSKGSSMLGYTFVNVSGVQSPNILLICKIYIIDIKMFPNYIPLHMIIVLPME